MGHYAKRGVYEGHNYLFKPKDLAKDQTYFLCQINEEQISSCLFPMSDITKVEARAIAKELGLSEVADKHGLGRKYGNYYYNGALVDPDSEKDTPLESTKWAASGY